ncbi:hypothetical protein [Herbaspirillum seropedicae]|uniref:hypothetical protein n=1 Tax=Herbaspirillum seropedicae TaxID=964 RepID=UPI003FCD3C86
MPQVDEFGWHGRIVVARNRREKHATSQQYGGLVDGGDLAEALPPCPSPMLAAGITHSSTGESAGKWQGLYPHCREFTKICSEKYPTYVVGNYKSKKICFFITMAHNSISSENRIDTGSARHSGVFVIHHMNITDKNRTEFFIWPAQQQGLSFC